MRIRRSARAAMSLSVVAAAHLAAQSEATWVEDETFFSEGLCAFVDPETGLTGYIDLAGRVAIPPRLASGGPFSEGFAVVSTEEADSELGGVDHYIDKAGTIVKTLDAMQEAQPFSDGLALIITYTGQSALSEYVNTRFEQVLYLPYEYEFGGSFKDGLAWVAVGDIFGPPDDMRYGYIDKSGALVIAAELRGPGSFDGGMAVVSVGRDTFRVIDTNGKVLREIEGEPGTTVEGPRDGAIIHHGRDGLIRAYGAGGALLYETRLYEHIFPYSEGLALAIKREPSLEGKDPMPFSSGYLDKSGNVAISFASPLGLRSRYSDGVYAHLDSESGLISFRDRAGRTVIAPMLSPAVAEEE